ncbi:bacterial transferase hexapeptide (six repeats) domain-containing protein [Hirsutella rhossiliensis]|uniref:Bacterial transferase hexapeptide (Six repeats) domain-containing protein n=1 Tax=Hirsutella rhossiliensis TaxID=111463 RepID=A0A9P8N0R9_9HYPO|nr:bacterial transferase hexapeptide (six repeats) domain-containing protein [Hirsutella rhossiliensis]KAH0963836.1 bacterial transferase hexapeptide (six repeats) domain-containing protein [Hirsutella rhossiliensis]
MSTFTALNGASPKTTDPPHPKATAENQAAVDDQPLGSALLQYQKPTDVPTNQRGSWRVQDRPSFHPANYSDAEQSHKRKRSDSLEPRHQDAPREPTPDTAPATSHAEARGSHAPTQQAHRQGSDELRDRDASPWSSQQGRDERDTYEARQRSATPTQGHMDEQAGDALRRAAGHMDHSDYSQTSPDAEDRSMGLYGSPYAADHRQDSMPHHDPKKRKRNFSNRTKTGCLTCRKRKKKCDEHKPECSNCIRGGFVCAGYPPQRGPGWQKPDNKAATVPLESKDPSYVPPGAYGMPQHGAAYGAQPVKREPLPHYRGQALRIDPPQGRPLAACDDDRPTASTLPSASAVSPESKLSAIAYAPGNAFPTPVSANTQPPSFGERMNKDYPRVPPLHDLGRGEPETPHPSNSLPQINILHPTRVSSPTAHPQPTSSSAQVAAQLALSHPQYPQRRTQKEEMLSGRHYYPFDKELCLERERCAVACWRFNNLTTPPTHGVSPDERSRLFLEILQPRDPVRVSPSEASPVTNVGRVGRHVAVETPFTCDYGYNISIGHHVVIGRHCTINDVCEVKIGDNCVIGPNVSLFTATLPIDPKKRQGGQGPQLGRGIIIEQDCWIGGGATILPGRTIGKGSTVGAGSIVTKDVPPFTVVAGNPARVLRGIGIAP